MRRGGFYICMLLTMLALSLSLPKASEAILCPTNTLATYIGFMSTGCTIDDKTFFDFSYTGAADAGFTVPTTAGITVTPITTPFNPGLSFGASWTVNSVAAGGPGGIDSKIGFSVKVNPGGNPIKDNSLGIAGVSTSGNGSVSVSENKCLGFEWGANTSCAGTIATLSVNAPPGTSLFNQLLFPNQTLIGVIKDIALSTGASGTASVSVISQNFSEVPEPASLLLLGSGLAAVGVWGRKSFSKNRA